MSSWLDRLNRRFRPRPFQAPRIPEGQQEEEARQPGDLRGTGLLPPELEDQERNRGDLRGTGLLPPELENQDLLGNIGQSDVNLNDYLRRTPGDLRGTGLLPPELEGSGNDQQDDDIPRFNFPNFQIPVVEPIPGINGENRNQSDKKRKITVSRNFLDPLSSWYFSRAKYGNKDGIRFINPIDNSRNLKYFFDSNPYDAEVSLNPQAEWSLAPFDQNGRMSEQVSTVELQAFVAAIRPPSRNNQNFQEYYKALFYSGNPYIYVRKSVDGNPPTYHSLSAEMLGATLQTSEDVLSILSLFNIGGGQIPLQQELDDIQVRYREQRNPPAAFAEEDDEIRLFLARLENLGIDLNFGNGEDFGQAVNRYRMSLRQRVSEGGQNVSFAQIIYDLLVIVDDDQISRDSEKQLTKYVIVQTMIRVLPSAIVGLRDVISREYTHQHVEFDTPYITNRKTYNFLNDGVQNNAISTINSNYNYYSKTYEDLSLDIPETLLPNLYVKQKYSDLSRRDIEDNTQESFKFNEMSTYLSLYGAAPNSLEYINFDKPTFYNLYAKGLEGISETNSQTLSIRQSNIILESGSVSTSDIIAENSPMAIGVKFSRESAPTIDNLISTLGVLDFRDTMFENINMMENQTPQVTTLYSTEFLAGSSAQLNYNEVESDYFEKTFPEFTINSILEPLRTEPSMLNVGETGQSSFTSLQLIKDGLLSISNSVTRNSPPRIINANDSVSEVLGYKISKKDADNNTQSFYIGTGDGADNITYNDSQIHYGKEYSYSLHEYRLIYGTKYSFNVFALDSNYNLSVPLWLMEYYLGIRTRLTQRQLIEDRPNISFRCWFETTQYPRVLEIPIYDSEYSYEVMPYVETPGSQQQGNLELGNGLSLDTGVRLQLDQSFEVVENINSIRYPLAKVLDYPPLPPEINIFPLLGNPTQVVVNSTIGDGSLLGEDAVEIVSIGDRSDRINILKDYQDNFKNIFLEPNFLEYRSEGLAEIRNVILYRATEINTNVEKYSDIYKSFNPSVNSSVVARNYTLLRDYPEDLNTAEFLNSYDVYDTISPNIEYFYTSVVEDIHGNPSNPSSIFRVRLLFDKGLLVPEITLVKMNKLEKKVPSKNLTEFIKIQASDIQTVPVVSEVNNEPLPNRSMGSFLSDSIENKSFVVRLTSKDTGRKFDLKLNFTVRINDSPIN
tara:strand:- start:4566 stop:8099 length:3534 start_codon:yes stop_codon:yes gene_type:complete